MPEPTWHGSVLDVRSHGVIGNGEAIDSPAINRAIDAAAGAGGGTVLLPRGVYACYSIRLKSGVRLYLDEGAEILAADPPQTASKTAGYDPPEDNTAADRFQDFGHNHWHNSLIWGKDLHNIAIEGPGLIHGKGLVNGDYETGRLPAAQPGVGNKAIALNQCANVLLKGFSILRGGHFGVLATGVSNLAISHLNIDTNRDGINIDCCRGVAITGCNVNSPNDDGICLKSTFALGRIIPTEDVTISGCTLRGDCEIGSMLDGTLWPLTKAARAQVAHPTGRIKLGTESVGGFRNITMKNNVFRNCRGIALLTVDGGCLENITVSGLEMHDVRTAPIFIRLGARLRGPEGVAPGTIRGITISDVYAEQSATFMPVVISGIPARMIDDVTMNNVHLKFGGGGTAAMAAASPPELPESYPEPERFGDLPASVLFARHIKSLNAKLTLEWDGADSRPEFWLNDVGEAIIDLRRVNGIVPGSSVRVQNVGRLQIDTGGRVTDSPPNRH